MEKIRARDGSIACFFYSRFSNAKAEAGRCLSAVSNQMNRLDTIGDTGT